MARFAATAIKFILLSFLIRLKINNSELLVDERNLLSKVSIMREPHLLTSFLQWRWYGIGKSLGNSNGPDENNFDDDAKELNYFYNLQLKTTYPPTRPSRYVGFLYSSYIPKADGSCKQIQTAKHCHIHDGITRLISFDC